LVGEGNLGLIRAVEEFDPRFGTRFSTYASYWIKQSIRHALINTTATIRLPAHMFNLMSKWRRAERWLARELGHVPTFEQVADALGLTDAQRELVEKAQRASHLRLEGGSGDGGNDWTAGQTAEVTDAPEESIEADDERRDLRRRMQRLD